MIVAGFVAVFMSDMTFFALTWLIGLAMVVEGVGEIISLIDGRKEGKMDPWALIAAIISIILGAFIIFSEYAELVAASFIIYFVAAWLVVLGVLSVLKANRDRKEGGMGWLPLLIGLLMIAFGIIGIVSPSFIAVAISVFAGLSLILSGASLAAQAIAY